MYLMPPWVGRKDITDEAELAGMPESAMAAAKANAEAKDARRLSY